MAFMENIANFIEDHFYNSLIKSLMISFMASQFGLFKEIYLVPSHMFFICVEVLLIKLKLSVPIYYLLK
jgi:hypothetical protein